MNSTRHTWMTITRTSADDVASRVHLLEQLFIERSDCPVMTCFRYQNLSVGEYIVLDKAGFSSRIPVTCGVVTMRLLTAISNDKDNRSWILIYLVILLAVIVLFIFLDPSLVVLYVVGTFAYEIPICSDAKEQRFEWILLRMTTQPTEQILTRRYDSLTLENVEPDEVRTT